MFALDANALIFALKGKGRLRERILAVPPNEIAVPAVVVFELEKGSLGSANPIARRRDLAKLLSQLTVLPLDTPAAEAAARIAWILEKSGQKIGPLDTLIAGIVLANGATLITHNTAEFSRVPGLSIEDWF